MGCVGHISRLLRRLLQRNQMHAWTRQADEEPCLPLAFCFVYGQAVIRLDIVKIGRAKFKHTSELMKLLCRASSRSRFF